MVLSSPAWRDPAIQALMLAELLVWSGFFYTLAALPLWIADSTGWSLSQIMGAYSVALVTMALTTPFAGRLIDRGLGPRSLPLGAAFGAVALALVATEPGLPVFYLLWALIGVAMGLTLYEPVFALITRARGDAARGGITAIAIAAGAASLVTFPMANLLAAGFGWPVALLAFAVLILFVAVPCLRFAAQRLDSDGVAEAAKPDEPGGRALFQDRQFRALALTFVLPALSSGLILSHILPLLDAASVAPAVAVAAAALIGPMQIAARLLTQAFANTLSAQRIVLFALLCLTAAAAALAFAGQALLALVLFVIAFGTGNGLVGVFRPLVIRDILGGAGLGTKAGAVAMPALLAVAAAPILGARILETADVEAFLVVAGAGPLLSFLALSALPKRDGT